MAGEVWQASRCVVLSEVPSTREKEKYYALLLENEARFFVDEGQTPHGDEEVYIANLRLLAPGIKKEKKQSEKAGHSAPSLQEKLERLKQNGFVSVTIEGVQAFDYTPYLRFVAIVAQDGDVCKPKSRILSWLMKLIEELYDYRFAYEKSDVERNDKTEDKAAETHQLDSQSFPVFVYKRLSTVLGLRFIIEQNSWDLLFNVDRLRSDYLEVEIFARFLQEFYDADDLLFFLYVRSVISSLLHINFRGRWSKLDGPGRQTPQALWMSHRECVQVARIVFGAKNEQLYKEFLQLVTPQYVGQKSDQGDSRRIDITQFVHLAVVGYHQTQKGTQTSSGSTSRPKRFSASTFPGLTSSLAVVAPSSSLDAYLNALASDRGAPSMPISPENVFAQLKQEREKEFLNHVCAPLHALLESGDLASEADYEAVLLHMIDELRARMNVLMGGQHTASTEDEYDAQLLNALRTPSLKAEIEFFRDELIRGKAR